MTKNQFSEMYAVKVFDPAKSDIVPRADQILGANVVLGSDLRPVGVEIHWESPEGQKKLQMRFPDMMRLLSVTKSIQLDSGESFPDDPRPKRQKQ